MTTLVELTEVSKTYDAAGGRAALDGVSWPSRAAS